MASRHLGGSTTMIGTITMLDEREPSRLLLCGLSWLVLAQIAGAQVFFGEDLNTSQDPLTLPDDPIPLAATPNADAASLAFSANLGGVVTESFETFGDGTPAPLALTFGSDTACLTGTNGLIKEVTAGTFNGTYPTEGTKFYLQSIGSPNTFQIDFSTPQAAFGFHATDVGDGLADMELTFDLSAGGTSTYCVPSAAGAANSGSVLFFGVIDTLNPFDRVTFKNTNPAIDGFGFDEMTIAKPEDVCSVVGAATEVVRAGSPANPAALLPGVSSGPVLGATWDPVIDHTTFLPSAITDIVGVALSPTNLSLPPFGTVLCDVFTFPPYVFTSAPGVPFAIPLPSGCSFSGISLCSQGVSVDGLGSIQLTNALDITIGTF